MSETNTTPAPNSNGADLTRNITSGFLVSLIALPLCLGIALASGFPPVAGVLTAIVGGLVGRFLGSAPLTIKGPAAGLIVIALGAVTELGAGDMALGYRRALAVGVVAAAIQIGFALGKVTKYMAVAPPSVVHGMLAAIGVIIFAKQAHVLMGVTPHGKKPLALLAEIPWSAMRDNPEILAIGVTGLAVLFAWPALGKRVPVLGKVPAPLVVLATAIPLGKAFGMTTPHDFDAFGHHYHLGPEFLLTLPSNLAKAIVTPDFSVVFSGTSLKYIVMFALVGSLESSLSVLAVDALSTKKEASNLDRDLLATGVANLLAAGIGGLPMISEIVRSKANIDNGASNAWSNFFHSAFLLFFVAAIPGLLHLVPLAALAAMLVFTGLRLASPKEVLHAKHVGLDQLLYFGVTLVLTLAEDLLVGIAAGILVKVALHAIRAGSLAALFRTEYETVRETNEATIRVTGPATFLSLIKAQAALAIGKDPTLTSVALDLSASPLVDHTFLDRVHAAAREWPNAKLVITGHETLAAVSEHPHSARRRVAARA